MVIIKPSELSQGALKGVLESFISREGTDYGEVELSLEQKLSSLLSKVLSGEVLIVFDEQHEQVNLISREQMSASFPST